MEDFEERAEGTSAEEKILRLLREQNAPRAANFFEDAAGLSAVEVVAALSVLFSKGAAQKIQTTSTAGRYSATFLVKEYWASSKTAAEVADVWEEIE